MKTRRIKNPTTGITVPAEAVDIEREENQPIFLTMSDGARIRVKVDVAEVVRLVGETNELGEPLYLVKHTITVALLDHPQENTV